MQLASFQLHPGGLLQGAEAVRLRGCSRQCPKRPHVFGRFGITVSPSASAGATRHGEHGFAANRPSWLFQSGRKIRGGKNHGNLKPRHLPAMTNGQGVRARKVEFKVKAPVRFGEGLLLVGSEDRLGRWDPTHAPTMRWSDGHVWQVAVELPEGSDLEYKFVVEDASLTRTGERFCWQPGENQTLHVPNEPSELVQIKAEWEPPAVHQPAATPKAGDEAGTPAGLPDTTSPPSTTVHDVAPAVSAPSGTPSLSEAETTGLVEQVERLLKQGLGQPGEQGEGREGIEAAVQGASVRKPAGATATASEGAILGEASMVGIIAAVGGASLRRVSGGSGAVEEGQKQQQPQEFSVAGSYQLPEGSQKQERAQQEKAAKPKVEQDLSVRSAQLTQEETKDQALSQPVGEKKPQERQGVPRQRQPQPQSKQQKHPELKHQEPPQDVVLVQQDEQAIRQQELTRQQALTQKQERLPGLSKEAPQAEAGRQQQAAAALQGGGSSSVGEAARTPQSERRSAREQKATDRQGAVAASEGDGRSVGGFPEWFRQSVVYHIQSLGFFGVEERADQRRAGKRTAGDRLKLLRDWYEHLETMGVNTIYFGPLFESMSHGYDTVDYFQIDRRLGTVALFREILDELHSRGIRVLLDGVFNHTGRDHFAFKDIVEHGPASRYRNWYHIRDGKSSLGDAFAYEGWEGHPELPRFNLECEEVQQHIFDVARFWLSDVGIDGWRLDVAHEIKPAFWREFSRVCKAAKPDCVLIGELIHGDYTKFVGPGLLDSCTNYQLSKAIWSSLNDRNYYELAHNVQRELDLYRTLDSMLNFVGNHDVPRIASKLKEPEHYFLAIAFLVTMRGVPCLYYGDECGMEGAPGGPMADLAMRQPLHFEHTPQNDRRFAQTTALIRWRRRSNALARGALALLGNTNTQLSFARWTDKEVVVVVLNCAPDAITSTVDLSRVGVPDGTVLRDALADSTVTPAELVVLDRKLQVRLGANSGLLLEGRMAQA